MIEAKYKNIMDSRHLYLKKSLNYIQELRLRFIQFAASDIREQVIHEEFQALLNNGTLQIVLKFLFNLYKMSISSFATIQASITVKQKNAVLLRVPLVNSPRWKMDSRWFLTEQYAAQTKNTVGGVLFSRRQIVSPKGFGGFVIKSNR